MSFGLPRPLAPLRRVSLPRRGLAADLGFNSIAFPLIGAGTGGDSTEDVLAMMQDELSTCGFKGLVRIVRFER